MQRTVADGPRGTLGLRLAVAFGAEYGLPAGELLEPVGLTAAEVDDAGAIIEAAQELAVIRALVRRLGDRPGLGAQLGRRYTLAGLRDLGFALMSAATMRDAVEIGTRYFGQSGAFVTLTVMDIPGAVRITVDGSAIPPDVRSFCIERDLAAMATVSRLLLPPAALASIPVRLAVEPARWHAFRGATGEAPWAVALASDDAHTTVDFPDALLATPLPQADSVAARELLVRVIETERRRADGAALASRVRAELMRADRGGATAEHVARALHLAPRTLRRRLAQDGLAFRQLADEVRVAKACAWLLDGISIGEVAHRLGYSETASFARAFTRWTGSSPALWRANAVAARDHP